LQAPLLSDDLHRDQVAAVDLLAVGGDRIHLVYRVAGPDVTVGTTSAGGEVDHDHIANLPCPLALHAQQSPTHPKHQVVALVLRQRLEHRELQLRGRSSDLELGYVALAIDIPFG